MKIKRYIFITALLLITNIGTFIATVYYFRTKTVNLLTVTRSTDPNTLFSLSSTPCQPNMMNGSCSNVAKANYEFIIAEENAYWQNQINDLREKALSLANTCRVALNNIPTYTPPSIRSTQCYTQAFTGNLICDTYGR